MNCKNVHILLIMAFLVLWNTKSITQITYNELFEIEPFGNRYLIRADNSIYCVDDLDQISWEISDTIFNGIGKRLGGKFANDVFFYLHNGSFKIYSDSGTFVRDQYHQYLSGDGLKVYSIAHDFILGSYVVGNITGSNVILQRQKYNYDIEFDEGFFDHLTEHSGCTDWIHRDSLNNDLLVFNNNFIFNDTVTVPDTGNATDIQKQISFTSNLSDCSTNTQILDSLNCVSSNLEKTTWFYSDGIYSDGTLVSVENCNYGTNINSHIVAFTSNGEGIILDPNFDVIQREVFFNDGIEKITGFHSDSSLQLFVELETNNLLQTNISIQYESIWANQTSIHSDTLYFDENQILQYIKIKNDEIPYNGIDDDCDPTTLDDDLDQDGFLVEDDCDDNNPDVNPNQEEEPYNGLDDDCDPTTLDDDLDQDGFLVEDDCDDNNPDVNPNQEEEPYNGLDDDCDPTTLDDDIDQDGFLVEDDCNDTDPNINPNVEEIPNNNIDEDCDGLDLIVSIQENNSVNVKFYPNPANNYIYIETEQHSDYKFKLYDQNGKTVKIFVKKFLLDVTNIPEGLYMLEIESLITGQKKNGKICILK